MIKSGARQETIFDTIRMLRAKGLTVQEAILEVESILRGKFSEDIKAQIYQECG